jgi:tetratricopeptide (TPR) repeat protein
MGKDGDPIKWRAAEAAWKRAEDLLGPLSSASTKQLVKTWHRYIAAGARAAEADHKFLSDLVDIRSAEAEDPDGSASDAAYQHAFRDAGLDVDRAGAMSTEQWCRTRPAGVALALSGALEDWAAQRRRARPEDRAGWMGLLAIARAIDPDPIRNRLRALWSESDRKAQRGPLLKLAGEADLKNWPTACLTLLAATLDAANERDAAIQFLRRAQVHHPVDVRINYNLGQMLEKAGPARADEAIGYYNVARAARPETGHELAHALERRGREDLALVILENLTRLRPDNGRHWGCYGKLLQNRGDRYRAEAAIEKAVALQRDVVRKRPDLYNVRSNLGIALARQGKQAEAIAEYKEVIRLRPGWAEVRSNLGSALLGLGKLADAIAELREAIRLKPDLAEGHYNLANALREAGEPDQAIASYREVIRLVPDSVDPHLALGAILCDAKHDFGAGEAEFREAIRLKPHSAAAYHNLGNALSSRGKLTEAVGSYRKAVELEPNLANAHYSLGIGLRAQGRLAEAVAELGKAIRLRPDYAFHNGLGLALADQGNLVEAIAAQREAIRLRPDFVNAHIALGAALYRQGKLAEAIAAYREAIRIKPDDAMAQNGLALALEAQGTLEDRGRGGRKPR